MHDLRDPKTTSAPLTTLLCCVDGAGIHFKMLNSRKGPAVWGPRAQADRDMYKEQMLRTMETTPNLKIIEASVEDILLDDNYGQIRGIKTADSE